ncbi:hypothetical protein AJ80_04369 [Polytolypa hystricis UAMH7299]|uniref:Uncharacterized protein n=1 Tax=Polytolypa hystricis (strain UAMH7299) TaxID=1447883 RepID=A0A2B7YB02_POLH7|nr:hypothetical protein AJ80_04369 [Polytolypa hystricis UAMH7299]
MSDLAVVLAVTGHTFPPIDQSEEVSDGDCSISGESVYQVSNARCKFQGSKNPSVTGDVGVNAQSYHQLSNFCGSGIIADFFPRVKYQYIGKHNPQMLDLENR